MEAVDEPWRDLELILITGLPFVLKTRGVPEEHIRLTLSDMSCTVNDIAVKHNSTISRDCIEHLRANYTKQLIQASGMDVPYVEKTIRVVDSDKAEESLSSGSDEFRKAMCEKVAGVTEMQKESTSNEGRTGKVNNNSQFLRPNDDYVPLSYKTINANLKDTSLLMRGTNLMGSQQLFARLDNAIAPGTYAACSNVAACPRCVITEGTRRSYSEHPE